MGIEGTSALLNIPVVVGLGDPVMDVLASVSADWLATVTSEPGGCLPVESDVMDQLLVEAAKRSELVRIPGGSAANVVKGIANIMNSDSSCSSDHSSSTTITITARADSCNGCGEDSGSSGAQGTAEQLQQQQRRVECRFVGMIGRDDTGAEYRRKLAAQGVTPLLLESRSGAPSATSLCLVTPGDGQRTMRTCLGASLELRSEGQIAEAWREMQGMQLAVQGKEKEAGAAVEAAAAAGQQQQQEEEEGDQHETASDGGSDHWAAGCALLHAEGYCLYRPQLAREVMSAARARGALVSLDLASFELVRNCKGALLGLLEDGLVDLIFANEEEAVTLANELQLLDQPQEHRERQQQEEQHPSQQPQQQQQPADVAAPSSSSPHANALTSASSSAAPDPAASDPTAAAVRAAQRFLLSPSGGRVRVAVTSLGARGCVARGTG
ncbi:hypothetical protein Agub_g14410, partial [Astrephomene gubernaculifera]